MNIETQVYETLRALVSDRVFPDVAPENTPRPYITYQNIGGSPLGFLDGSVPEKEFARVQVNVWADTRSNASDLGKSVELTLRNVAAFQTEVLSGRAATYDEMTGYRGTMQDFNFFT